MCKYVCENSIRARGGGLMFFFHGYVRLVEGGLRSEIG